MRPRMEPAEIRFLIGVIDTALERIKEMKRQHKELKQDVWRLRDEVQKGGSHLIKALIKAREQLEQDKWKEQYIYDYQQACNLMLRLHTSCLLIYVFLP